MARKTLLLFVLVPLGALMISFFGGCLPIFSTLDLRDKEDTTALNGTVQIDGRVVVPAGTSKILATIKKKVLDFSPCKAQLLENDRMIAEQNLTSNGEFHFTGVAPARGYRLMIEGEHLRLYYYTDVELSAGQSLFADIDLESTAEALVYEKARAKFPDLRVTDVTFSTSTLSLVSGLGLYLESFVALPSFSFSYASQPFLDLTPVTSQVNAVASAVIGLLENRVKSITE